MRYAVNVHDPDQPLLSLYGNIQPLLDMGQSCLVPRCVRSVNPTVMPNHPLKPSDPSFLFFLFFLFFLYFPVKFNPSPLTRTPLVDWGSLKRQSVTRHYSRQLLPDPTMATTRSKKRLLEDNVKSDGEIKSPKKKTKSKLTRKFSEVRDLSSDKLTS